MSDGDQSRVGPPVIHVTPSDSDTDEKAGEKASEATGRHGFRDVKQAKKTDSVVRRSKKGLSNYGGRSRRTTLVDGHPSTLTGEGDKLRALTEDDYASSDASDAETEFLKAADIRVLESALSQLSLDSKTFTADQLKRFAEQLHVDIDNFRQIISQVRKYLKDRENVSEDVQKTMNEQCDKISNYSKTLNGKLNKLEKAAKAGHTSLVLKSGAGLHYKGDDLGFPKGDESEDALIPGADIVCDAYKQLLSMSRLWKMEWPSFFILTTIAAAYAGIDIKNGAEVLPMTMPVDESLQDLAKLCHETITRLREQESLCLQLKGLSKKNKDSGATGVAELLGTIFPDEDSGLKSMPMDYYYTLGGHFAQKARPMELFEKRLERVTGQISTLRREAEHIWQQLSGGKKTFIGATGVSTDVFREYGRIKKQQKKLEEQWQESFPSVQRVFTDQVRKSKKRS